MRSKTGGGNGLCVFDRILGNEARKVLAAVVVELGLFHCRYTQPTTGMEVKVDLQLYQIDHKNYLLDFKCVSPSEAELSTPSSTERHYTMEFFEMCARIISSLAQ